MRERRPILALLALAVALIGAACSDEGGASEQEIVRRSRTLLQRRRGSLTVGA